MLAFSAFLPGWADDLSASATLFTGGGPATALTDCSSAFFTGMVTVLAEAATAASEITTTKANTAMQSILLLRETVGLSVKPKCVVESAESLRNFTNKTIQRSMDFPYRIDQS